MSSARALLAHLPRRTACLVLTALVAVALTTVVTPRPARAATRTDVLHAAAGYAKQQGYHVGIAVLDTKTGQLRGAGYCKGIFASESLIKVFIATRLLVEGRMHGSTAARAWKMITQSDDAIATSFYGSVGGDDLINWIKARYHVPDLGYPPSQPGWWGNTHLRPCGLVKLYAKLKKDHRVAPWLLNAMHHAREYGSDGTYQFFGIPSATKGFAVKQGWGTDYEVGSNADFNSTGFVDNNRYAIAILARGPSYTYGSDIGGLLTGVARRLLPNGSFPAPRPTLLGLGSRAGRTTGGSRVTVRGTDFSHVTKVLFGSKPGRDIKVLSPTRLTVTTTAHQRKWVNVYVFTTHGRTYKNPHSRFLFEQPPSITTMSSHIGRLAGGSTLTIRGRAFVPGTKVSFGTVPATSVKRVSRWKLQAVVPKHAAGVVTVKVSSPFGHTLPLSTHQYTYAGAPTITSVSPLSGPAGTRITITGTDFRKTTTVKFGDVLGERMFRKDATTILVTAPAQPEGTAPGPADLTVTTPYGTTTDEGGFRYTP